MPGNLATGFGIHQPNLGLKNDSQENFNCIFPIYFQLYFNETVHAYEKQRFIEIVWVKITKSAFEMFT